MGAGRRRRSWRLGRRPGGPGGRTRRCTCGRPRRSGPVSGARPERLTLASVGSPIGTIVLATDEGGVLRALEFADQDGRLERSLARRYPRVPVARGEAPAA